MTATITEPLDLAADVAAVVEATRHLHDFREGLAEALETLAMRAPEYMPDNGKATLLPLLQVLGTERSHRFADRLYRIASDLSAGYQPHVNIDRTMETLHAVIHEAVNAIMAEIYRGVRCCCGEASR